MASGLSLLIVILGMSYYRFIQYRYCNDNAYRIVAIIQSCSQAEPLKTSFLAEHLNLSYNRPKNLYAFNLKEAQNRFLSLPMVKEGEIKKIPPGTLYINYSLRKPIAYLADLTNTVIDSEGYPFPLKPFFTPKTLPEIYLGLYGEADQEILDHVWGKPIKHSNWQLALNLYDYLHQHYCSPQTSLKRIDVSCYHALSSGQRQIVVVFEEQLEKEIEGKMVLLIYPEILRLDVHDYKQGLANYSVLKQQLFREAPVLNNQRIIRQPTTTIDLRLSQLAFIKQENR